NVLAAGDVVVLDHNGKLIEDWSPAGHYHVTLTLQQMGPYAPNAVLAAEDRNFYNHGAIDPGSTARAAWVDVTSHGLNQGGSTITQQLVKIQLLTPQKSVTRKIQEVVLAIALEQRYSKDQILGMYLNRVYFGHGAYLFGAAAVQQGGIVVHTTLDLTVQQDAEAAIANGVQDLKPFNVNNSALLAADPKTGAVLAWVGSADYGNDAIGGQFDVVLSPRQ